MGMTSYELVNKEDEEILNLLILATEVYAVDYYRMELDQAYKKKQTAWLLKAEILSRLRRKQIVGGI